MKTLARLVTTLAAGSLAVVPGAHLTREIGPRGAADPQSVYSKNQREYYMTADEVAYIRPGLHITVNSITIPADRRPVVDLTFTDDLGQPLDRNGRVTPGSLSVSQVLAWWDGGARYYTAYTTRQQTSPITGVTATQASADSGGTWTDHAVGHSSYRFKTALPEGFDQTKTHTLGIYATRNLTDIIGKNYYDNVEHDFRPDNAMVTETWDKMATGVCNQCHDLLAEHGGSRQETKLCVLCHSPQTVDPDTGNTVEMRVMIHKIHRGEFLPSVEAGTPYQIIGNQQSVHDYSTVVFPQDIRNCTRCHREPATQTHVWFTFPSRAACGSCHDDINWVTGENHAAGAQPDDSACASCHRPQGDREWDASIKGAHTVPYKSTQLKGLHTDILAVTNTAPGQRPTVQFRITEDSGAVVSPATFGSNLNLLMGGPTTDYDRQPFREQASAAVFNGDTAMYTFTNPIPATAVGTWTFSIECRRTVVLDPAPSPEQAQFTEGAVNDIFYAAVTDPAPVPRRAIVELANCNTCHDRLMLHGGQRLEAAECVLCHNPNADDSRYRTEQIGGLPAESIDFKRMIHRIHTGEELTQDYTVIGRNGSVNDFNEVRYPGDRRDCTSCHVNDAWNVPEVTQAGRLPTITMRDWYTPQQPNSAACLGCHDSQSAAAHAFVNTAPFGEACAACHGVNAEFAVEKVHAR